MGNGMNKVLPGLYVGNYRDSKDQQQLDKYQITHIIAIHDSPRRLLPDKHYLCVMAADTPDQNLSQYFSVCNDFIHAARLREGNVLIHCLAGMSRSVTVAVAYIMTATDLNWKEALKVVRAGRAVANPNVGFQTQLQEFEMFRLMEERRRLRERFPSTALEQLDRTKCSAALDSYRELLQNRDICEGNCTRGEKCPTGASRTDGDGASVNTAEDNLDAGGSASGADPPHKRYTSYMLTFAVEQWKTLRRPTRRNDDDSDDVAQSSDRFNVGLGERLMKNVVYYAPLTKPPITDEQNAHDETKSQEELVRNEDQVEATNENITEKHATLTKPDEQDAHDEKKNQEDLVRNEDQVTDQTTNENIIEKHASMTKPDEQDAHDEKKSEEELIRNEDQVTDQTTNENIIEKHASMTKPDEQNAHDEKKSEEELIRNEDQVVADEQDAHDEKKSQEELIRNEDEATDQATNKNIIEKLAE